MSKKTWEDTELQKLTLSPTNVKEINASSNVIEDPARPSRQTSIIINQAANLPSLPERRKAEKLQSSQSPPIRVPSLKVTTNQNAPKICYSNEVKESSKNHDRSSQREKRVVSHTNKNMNSNSALKSQMKQTPLNSKLDGASRILDKMGKDGFSSKTPNNRNLFSHSSWKTEFGESSPSGKNSKNVGFSRLPPGVSGDSSISSKTYGNRRPVLDIPQAGIQSRPCPHHSFLTDAQDVRQIEQGLLQLMEDFQTGNLRAFGKDSRLRQMEEIREQQEKLAKMHFDVGAEQDLLHPLSEDGLRTSEESMRLLMENLAHLSIHIENLDTNAHPEKDKEHRSNRNSNDNGHNDTPKDNKPPNKPVRKSLTSPPIIESSLHNTIGHKISEVSLPPSHSPPQLRKSSKE